MKKVLKDQYNSYCESKNKDVNYLAQLNSIIYDFYLIYQDVNSGDTYTLGVSGDRLSVNKCINTLQKSKIIGLNGIEIKIRLISILRFKCMKTPEKRVEYNAKRRKVRKEPNASLFNMTVDEREAHRRLQKAKSQYVNRKKEIGWCEEKIEKQWLILRKKKCSSQK